MPNKYYSKKKKKIVIYSEDEKVTYQREKDARLRYFSLVLKYYGARCACCGETNILFLTVDHINNDGQTDVGGNGKRLSGKNLYKRVVDKGFPSSYQILCFNCNMGKYRAGGICPHNIVPTKI